MLSEIFQTIFVEFDFSDHELENVNRKSNFGDDRGKHTRKPSGGKGSQRHFGQRSDLQMYDAMLWSHTGKLINYYQFIVNKPCYLKLIMNYAINI